MLIYCVFCSCSIWLFSDTVHYCGINVLTYNSNHFYFSCGRYMACKESMKCSASCSNPGWSHNDLDKALSLVREENVSIRTAALTYGIPKSTLHDHYTGKVKGNKRGPSTVLSDAEELKLAEWAMDMANIGYGRTREQVSEMVKRLLDEDGRPNPFVDNYPGRDWWYGFLRRHPQISLRSPEQLQLSRAFACSQERLCAWYGDYEEFLKMNDISNPDQIWNADETGFSLCPKSGRVLAMRGSKDVYQVTENSKEQVTTLCAVNAAGTVVPPMHVFAGKRFKFDPMNGSVPNAYFGKSDKGWINTQLFYKWLEEHFIKRTATIRPLVLLIDGHSSHIDIDTSKLCRDNNVLLYCLPPHSSHITQPLDVGFYGPLKAAWRKAVAKYALDNVGKSVTKYTFAEVFKEAWVNTVKLSTIVNSFRCAGIWPVNANVCKRKLGPATLYEKKDKSDGGSKLAAEVESTLSSATKKKFKVRYEEGYDVKDDELYNVWVKLKTLTLDDSQEAKDSKGASKLKEMDTADKSQEAKDSESASKLKADTVDKIQEAKHSKGNSKQKVLTVDDGKDSKSISNSQQNVTVESSQEKVGAVFKQALVLPECITRKKTLGRSTKLPAHISGDEAIAQMEDKIKQQQIAEEEKKKRKEEREMKRLQKQKEKEEKAKKSSRKKGATNKKTGLSDDDDVKCPVCNNDDPQL